jgi:uncharacterized protein YacL
MMLKGLTPGAAFVFLMTGPATNAASFVTIWKIMGRATALTYLAAVAGCALASGIILDLIITSVAVEHLAHHHTEMLPPVVKYISAFILFAVLAFAILMPKKPENHNST